LILKEGEQIHFRIKDVGLQFSGASLFTFKKVKIKTLINLFLLKTILERLSAFQKPHAQGIGGTQVRKACSPYP